MPINFSSFVADYPEFANSVRFPPSAVNYWGAVANILLNSPRSRSLWDTTPGGFTPPPPAPVLGQTSGGIFAQSTCYVVTTYTTSMGETTASWISSLVVNSDNLLTVQSPPSLGFVTGWNVYVGTTVGDFSLQNTPPIAIGTNWTEPNTGIIDGASPPEYNTSGPKNLLDFGCELYIAHNLALERQASDAAEVEAVPGTVGGAIVSRTVNGVTISYDASSGIEKDAGHWNLTTYGRRLIRLMNIVGAVPIQIGVGTDPTGGMNGPGWSGPPPWIIGSPGSAIY
jgi:Protein of unknown function (DUF4054)